MITSSPTSRTLISIAANPTCQRLIRMRAMGLSDQDGYRLLTDKELPVERGERSAALRHGQLFDRHLVDKRATALLTSIQAVAPFDPNTARILDVENAARKHRGDPLKHALLLTDQGLCDAANHRPSQDILLQPALKLSRVKWGSMTVRPDALVLDRERNWYWPLEAKSYPAIDGRIEPAERRSMRLQAAVQLIALQDATALTQPHLSEALLVVASPFGLTPEPAILEQLDAEINLTTHAIDAVNAESLNLQVAPVLDRRAASLREANCNIQESCVSGCGLFNYCRAEQPGFHRALGNTAQRILPPPQGRRHYFDELRTSAPEFHVAWRELAALLGLEGEHGAT